MTKSMQWLMLSCWKATELIEKRLVTPLSFREKIQLHLHKSMCDACRNYEKQSRRIDALLKKNIQGDAGASTLSSPELKEKILGKIK